MDRARRWWLLLPEGLRRFPADLALVILGILTTILVVITPVVNETPLRVVVGLPFVLFLPGYAFIAALFPEAGESPTPDSTSEPTDGQAMSDRGIDGIERVALSFGLSIAIVPLLGLVLNFTPWGIRLVPILLAVGGFTIACAGVAHYRRQQLPVSARFVVPFRQWFEMARTELFEPDDRTDAALNILLAISIILAFATVGYAIMVPPQGEQFTEFYLLTADEEGEFVAASYPELFLVGEGQDVVLGITNNEHQSVQYSVVVQLQAETRENNTTVIQERSELQRFSLQLAHNETWQESITVTPDFAGEDLRLQFLLYKGDPPQETNRENAYRDLHLWIDVEES